MFARRVAPVGGALFAGLAAASPVLFASKLVEGTPEYEKAKALYTSKHEIPLEGFPPKPAALSPDEFRTFTVDAVATVSHDTARLRFKLPSEDDTLGLTVASCLVAKADIDGKAVVRPYTPVSSTRQRGSFELVVKGYPEGSLSKHIVSLAVGDKLDFKGPWVKLEYKPNMKTAIGMVAGGTGITPMYQLLRKVLENPRDKTQIRLLYANKTPEDILLKDELDALAELYPNFSVTYTIDNPTEGWDGLTGHVNKAMIAATLPSPGDDNLILVCGPPGMVAAVSGPLTKDYKQGEVDGILKTMGYTSDHVFKF